MNDKALHEQKSESPSLTREELVRDFEANVFKSARLQSEGEHREANALSPRIHALRDELYARLSELDATRAELERYTRGELPDGDLLDRIEELQSERRRKGSIKIDHGSIDLDCKPETIQLFVDRMIAARVERVQQETIELRKDAERYRYVRRLNVTQFKTLFDRNLFGEGRFDDLVDENIPRTDTGS